MSAFFVSQRTWRVIANALTWNLDLRQAPIALAIRAQLGADAVEPVLSVYGTPYGLMSTEDRAVEAVLLTWWRANIDALLGRYSEEDACEMYEGEDFAQMLRCVPAYPHVAMCGVREPRFSNLVTAYKAVQSLHYQCSEDVRTGKERHERVLKSIEDFQHELAAAALRVTKEYDAAPWG